MRTRLSVALGALTLLLLSCGADDVVLSDSLSSEGATSTDIEASTSTLAADLATTTVPAATTTTVPAATTTASGVANALTIDQVGTVSVRPSGALELAGAACFPNASIVAGTPEGWTVSLPADGPQGPDFRVGRAVYVDGSDNEVVVDFPTALADPDVGEAISEDLGGGLVLAIVDEDDRVAIRPMWTGDPAPNVEVCEIGYWSSTLSRSELQEFVDSISIEAEA